jgi:HPt (histidine-containing phosphotransfer) domain-containing protein
MDQPHSYYSYQYLYKISSTSPTFIKKMIALFLNSLAEYISDLEQQLRNKSITDLKKVVHKLKPSVMSLEVKGARHELGIIDEADKWTLEVQSAVERLLATFKEIQPMMQADLASYGDI